MEFDINVKIGRFWNKEIIDNSIKEREGILQVLNLNKMCLEKVSSGDWKQKDYKDFSSLISMLFINRINIIYPITEAFLKLPHEECKEEVEKLLSKLYIDNCEIKYFGKSLGKIINTLQAKILSITNLAITDEEKKLVDPIAQKIELYQEIEKQVDDDNSDYIALLRDFFKNWVEETFDNETLKQSILELEEEVIKTKRIRTKQKILKIYNMLEHTKERDIKAHKLDVKAKYMSYK